MASWRLSLFARQKLSSPVQTPLARGKLPAFRPELGFGTRRARPTVQAWMPARRMNKLTTIEDLFLEELQEMYTAETQLAHTLPKLSLKVTSGELEAALDLHLEETRNHV